MISIALLNVRGLVLLVSRSETLGSRLNFNSSLVYISDPAHSRRTTRDRLNATENVAVLDSHGQVEPRPSTRASTVIRLELCGSLRFSVL